LDVAILSFTKRLVSDLRLNITKPAVPVYVVECAVDSELALEDAAKWIKREAARFFLTLGNYPSQSTGKIY
jgi:hypothetical protein